MCQRVAENNMGCSMGCIWVAYCNSLKNINNVKKFGVPYGSRTRVLTVKGMELALFETVWLS